MRFFWDLPNELITREVRLTPFEVEWHSGDSVRVGVTPTFDRLEGNFNIHEGIVLPNGESAKAGCAILLPRGNVFSENRRELSLRAGIRRRPGLELSLDSEWS